LESIDGLDTGGLSEPVKFSATDHAGVQTVRPYKWNFEEKAFEAVGEFTDYQSLISNEYLEEGAQ
jgi:hypothetical protein